MTFPTFDGMRLTLQKLLKRADAFDLSWSSTEQGVERRALIGWLIGNAPHDELVQLSLQWGMPAPMVNRWREGAREAEGVGLTINADLTSLRLYTHRWKGVAPDDFGAVVYTGYKCLADGAVRVDEYKNFGDLRQPENSRYAMENSAHPERVERVLQSSPDNVPLIYAQIENSGRRSWLVTVRHAKINAGAVIGKDYQGSKLLHLAGGIDATKGAFDTFYVGTSPQDVFEFLNRVNVHAVG